MDALKFIEERNRMCNRYWQVDGDCDGCPLLDVKECNELRNMIDDTGKVVGNVVEIVEKWSQEHPRKTRQSEFLKMFPTARLDYDGVLVVCPADVDINKRDADDGECLSPLGGCENCCREFWTQEVE